MNRAGTCVVFVAASAVLMCAALVHPGVVWAEVAVGVTSRSISINETLRPGTLCELPKIGVANTGDVESTYTVSFVTIPQGGRLEADPSWLEAKPRSVSPKPGRIEHVAVALSIPDDAKPGAYAVYFKASPPPIERGENPIVIGALTKIEFRVAGTALPHESEPVERGGAARGYSWRLPLYVLLAVAALALIGLVGKNLRISVRWGRRRDE